MAAPVHVASRLSAKLHLIEKPEETSALDTALVLVPLALLMVGVFCGLCLLCTCCENPPHQVEQTRCGLRRQFAPVAPRDFDAANDAVEDQMVGHGDVQRQARRPKCTKGRGAKHKASRGVQNGARAAEASEEQQMIAFVLATRAQSSNGRTFTGNSMLLDRARSDSRDHEEQGTFVQKDVEQRDKAVTASEVFSI